MKIGADSGFETSGRAGGRHGHILLMASYGRLPYNSRGKFSKAATKFAVC
jgi:hypothetical protein